MTVPIPGQEIPGPEGSDPLKLVAPLGNGAFGMVYSAVDGDGRRFAVKFPQLGLFAGESERLAFMNEVQAAETIQHPNVLPVLHVVADADEGPVYLVLEFADGGTLAERLRSARDSGQQLDQELVLQWTRDLVSGMAAINDRMLHRDVKPDNILFVEDVLKVSDFGLSKLVGAATRTRSFKGGQQVYYMAPEGWLGQKNDIQLDMYAVGITVFEMAALTYPYKAPTDPHDLDALKEMHLTQVPRSLRDVRPDLPARLSDLVTRLMEKRPSDRYSSWTLVAEALGAIHTDSTKGGARASIRNLVSHAQARRTASTEARVREEATRRQAAELRKIDEYQADRLREQLHAIITEFNAASEAGEIRVLESGGGWSIHPPYGRTATLSLFGVNPEMDLRSGTCRFAATLRDERGCGFNFLLSRHRDGDEYGEWLVGRTRPNVLTGRTLVEGCQSLALGPSDVHEIGTALRAMHIYTVKLSSDIEGEFIAFLGELMSVTG